MPDGFEIEFTLPVNRQSAEDLASYLGRSYIYKYHPVYGSPTVNEEKLIIKGVKVSDDNRKVRVVIDNLRQYYLHELTSWGIRSQDGNLPLLHHTAYYTLNNIQEGAKLPVNELSIKNSQSTKPKTTPVKTTTPKTTSAATTKAITYAEIEPLLKKNTCTACHQQNARQVGPAFADVAKRKYTDEKIVELIYTPQPKNWPEYATPMAALPQVPKDEALKIARWINSLRTTVSKNNP
jgi:cytochrome c551/c552